MTIDFNALIGQKLKDALGELDPNTKIYIGSASSYFDVAKAGELRSEVYLDNLSKKLHALFKNRADCTHNNLEKLFNTPPKWSGVVDDDLEKSIRSYSSKVIEYKGNILSTLRSFQEAKRKENEFVPLQDRSVKDAYFRLNGIDVCIIVPGDEIGAYWFEKEKQEDAWVVRNG